MGGEIGRLLGLRGGWGGWGFLGRIISSGREMLGGNVWSMSWILEEELYKGSL